MSTPIQQILGDVDSHQFVWDVGTLSWIAWDGSITVGPVTIADGADVTLGALADAAIDSDAAGTVSGKLRGVVKILADVWNNATHKLKIEGTLSTTPPSAGTGTITSVADSASNQTLLASNANRLGFTIYNDSDKAVYVKLGATATVTDFTKLLLPNDFWGTKDLGVNYTGIIDGIWEANSTGSARVTELTV